MSELRTQIEEIIEKPNPTLAELRTFVGEELASFKRPDGLTVEQRNITLRGEGNVVLDQGEQGGADEVKQAEEDEKRTIADLVDQVPEH